MTNQTTMREANILVIDDEPGIREGCRRALTAYGYKVDTAEDGEIGLSKVRSGGFDLVLLDIMMPGISGIDFGSLETGGAPTVALNMSGDAEVATQSLADIWATLTGNSILRLNGSARAINWATIIDLSTAHKNAKIHFINWTPTQLIDGKSGNSLLQSTYTNGSVIRVNGIVVTQSNYSGLVAIESDGAVGSYVYVPEPATLFILAVGSLLCVRRK